eukprot:m.153493 g.153493  ORF g.153493 m.153493 type:complete len:301 (+) comp16940_c0_seq5:219-1121(+)
MIQGKRVWERRRSSCSSWCWWWSLALADLDHALVACADLHGLHRGKAVAAVAHPRSVVLCLSLAHRKRVVRHCWRLHARRLGLVVHAAHFRGALHDVSLGEERDALQLGGPGGLDIEAESAGGHGRCSQHGGPEALHRDLLAGRLDEEDAVLADAALQVVEADGPAADAVQRHGGALDVVLEVGGRNNGAHVPLEELQEDNLHELEVGRRVLVAALHQQVGEAGHVLFSALKLGGQDEAGQGGETEVVVGDVHFVGKLVVVEDGGVDNHLGEMEVLAHQVDPVHNNPALGQERGEAGEAG